MDKILNTKQCDKQETMAHYILLTEEARALSDRRTRNNSCFIAFNLVCIIGACTLVKWAVLCFIGIALCIVWIENLHKAKAVSDIKFKAKLFMEQNLSYAMSTYEWNLLQSNSKKLKFKLFDKVEIKYPYSFLCAYVFILVDHLVSCL